MVSLLPASSGASCRELRPTRFYRIPDSNYLYPDNLAVLREHVADESVDLVYLGPPFNSARNYSVLFAEQDGTRAAAQIKAFDDTDTQQRRRDTKQTRTR